MDTHCELEFFEMEGGHTLVKFRKDEAPFWALIVPEQKIGAAKYENLSPDSLEKVSTVFNGINKNTFDFLASMKLECWTRQKRGECLYWLEIIALRLGNMLIPALETGQRSLSVLHATNMKISGPKTWRYLLHLTSRRCN